MPRWVPWGWPQFPGTDAVGGGGRDARRCAAPEPAGRGRVPRGPCALPTPAALGSPGPGPRGTPIPLRDPRALLPSGELEPPVPHLSPSPLFLPPLRDFCPSGVGRCRWTGLERRDTPAASPSPGVTPARLPPVRTSPTGGKACFAETPRAGDPDPEHSAFPFGRVESHPTPAPGVTQCSSHRIHRKPWDPRGKCRSRGLNIHLPWVPAPSTSQSSGPPQASPESL